MSSKGFHRVTLAKHVSLRTQQRRLRHVKSITVRNLIATAELRERGQDPLNIGVYFTIHPFCEEDRVLYQSEVITHSYNPSWESVQFTTIEFGKLSSISGFTVKLWVQPLRPSPSPPSLPTSSLSPHANGSRLERREAGESEAEREGKLAFERTIDLSDLVYLGTLVNKDGSCYPSNSVVIGMYEGYYSDAGVGGVLAIPHISHSLVDLLPPCSLLEVPRGEVFDSYFSHTLLRTLNRQEVLDKETVTTNISKGKVQSYLQEQEEYFKKKREKESLKMRMGLLQRQILQQEKLEKEESEELTRQKESLDAIEFTLRDQQATLQQLMTQYQVDYHTHHQNMDLLARTQKSKTLRQRNMIYELCQTFVIKEVEEVFAICNVILPNADQLDHVSSSSIDQFGVSLGYAAHLVSHLSTILLIPLQYPIKPNGSRSSISDHISEEAIIDTIKEFPLYLRGSEKALFLYAIHLFNKDIGQMRQHCGYGGSRSMLKKTLPNLKYLLDELIKDFFVSKQSQKMPTMRNPSQPINTNSLLENGSLRRFERMSTLSSQCSSLATTATIGLSLTPPTSSPMETMNHEDFHNAAQPGSMSRQVVPNSNGRGESQNENETEKLNDFGVFRSRSNHIAGNYPTELPPGSPRNSSHERLHYDPSMETEKKDDVDRFSEKSHYSNEPLASEIPPVEGDDSSSPTPTPPTPHSLQDSQLQRYLNRAKTGENEDGNSGIYFRQQDLREGSPAGTGLFDPCSSPPENSGGGLFSDTPGSSELNRHSVLDGHEGEGIGGVVSSRKPESSPSLSATDRALFLEKVDLHSLNAESNLDFPNRRRSSKLVDPSDIQARRVRVETREHNLPPEALHHGGEKEKEGDYRLDTKVSTPSGFSTTGINSRSSSRTSSNAEEGQMVQPQVFVQSTDHRNGRTNEESTSSIGTVLNLPSQSDDDRSPSISLSPRHAVPSGVGGDVLRENSLKESPLVIPDRIPPPPSPPQPPSSPQVSFAGTVHHTPMYRNFMATPHVLGTTTVEPSNIGNGLELKTGSNNPRSQSGEGDAQFLEDFIDMGL